MDAIFDVDEEQRSEIVPSVAEVAEVDVLGLYRPDVAAAASRVTACDPGSGPTRIDD